MANEGTKAQIKAFIENAITNAQNPNPREALKKERAKRAKIMEKKYGF